MLIGQKLRMMSFLRYQVLELIITPSKLVADITCRIELDLIFLVRLKIGSYKICLDAIFLNACYEILYIVLTFHKYIYIYIYNIVLPSSGNCL